MSARSRVQEAERALADLGDVEAERAAVEDLRMTVEAARITMMSRRSAHDEVRREGEARLKRSQEVTKEVSGWKHGAPSAGIWGIWMELSSFMNPVAACFSLRPVHD